MAEYLAGHPAIGAWEIVVCNDGSTDATGEILAELHKSCPELVVVDFAANRGAGAAIAAAIAHTRLDWVVLLDSDGQFPIANLDAFLDRVRTGEAGRLLRRPHQEGRRHRVPVGLGGQRRGQQPPARHPVPRLQLDLQGGTRPAAARPGPGVERDELLDRDHRQGHGARPYLGGDPDRAPGARRRRRGWRFWRGARDRALFVGYLGYRRWLLRRGVLRLPEAPQEPARDLTERSR